MATSPSPGRGAKTPLVIATWSFSAVGVSACAKALCDGSSALAAVVDGVTAVELDETVTSVGYGGLPTNVGRLELDAAIMTGDGRIGAVAAVPDCKAAAPVAKAVLDHCRHTMLAGEGAAVFARAHGLTSDSDTDLLSAHARKRFDEYCAASNRGHPESQPVSQSSDPEALLHTDTVGMICVDRNGDIAACCATSGMEFKENGRVGDAPIVGAGVFADRAVGAAVASGEGDKMIRYCMSFLAVEEMRRGASPTDACQTAVRRIREADPGCQAAICAVDVRTGATGASCTREGFKLALWDEAVDSRDFVPRIVPVQGLPPCKPWKHTCV